MAALSWSGKEVAALLFAAALAAERGSVRARR
jgi:hypothetical protein